MQIESDMNAKPDVEHGSKFRSLIITRDLVTLTALNVKPCLRLCLIVFNVSLEPL
jgi:hypothetical protein